MATTARRRRPNWLLLPVVSISSSFSVENTTNNNGRRCSHNDTRSKVVSDKTKQNKRGFFSTARYKHTQITTNCNTLLLVIASIFLHSSISLSNKLSLSIDSFSQLRITQNDAIECVFAFHQLNDCGLGSLQLKSLIKSENIYKE